ncbi:transcriptional regulator [Aquitalea magnusonii]|nr:transcriptional regulator [Aquitalea magnusonii]
MSSSIDLRQLRYFLAVSEELSFGRAARRLHISQPPLSRQIRQLEDQLGVELFQRNKAGVTLTQAGAAFLPEVRRTLAQAEKAIAVARATRDSNGGQFVVGYTTVFDRSTIPDVLDQLRPHFPHWRITSKGKHSISLVRDIKSGAMDAAFIGLHSDAQGLTVETIVEESFVVALSSKHRLAQKRRLCFKDLDGEPIFWFERRLNPGFYDHCQAFFEKIGFKPSTIAEPADHHIMLGLISEGQGIALIPMSMRKVKYQGVAFREINEDREKLSIGIGVAYSEHNQSPVLHTFLELVRQAR